MPVISLNQTVEETLRRARETENTVIAELQERIQALVFEKNEIDLQRRQTWERVSNLESSIADLRKEADRLRRDLSNQKDLNSRLEREYLTLRQEAASPRLLLKAMTREARRRLREQAEKILVALDI